MLNVPTARLAKSISLKRQMPTKWFFSVLISFYSNCCRNCCNTHLIFSPENVFNCVVSNMNKQHKLFKYLTLPTSLPVAWPMFLTLGNICQVYLLCQLFITLEILAQQVSNEFKILGFLLTSSEFLLSGSDIDLASANSKFPTNSYRCLNPDKQLIALVVYDHLANGGHSLPDTFEGHS